FVLAAAIAALASHAQLNAQDRTRADQPLSPDAPPPRARLAELGELHTQLGRQTLYAVERAAPEAAELVVSLDPTGRDPFRILDRVLLQFEPEVPPAEVRAILSRHGITGPLAPLGRLPNAWMATGSSARRALDSAAALAGEPKVLWAQP